MTPLLRRFVRRWLQLGLVSAPLSPKEAFRASGDCTCDICFMPYDLHPPDPEQPDLQILCDGQRVKL